MWAEEGGRYQIVLEGTRERGRGIGTEGCRRGKEQWEAE